MYKKSHFPVTRPRNWLVFVGILLAIGLYFYGSAVVSETSKLINESWMNNPSYIMFKSEKSKVLWEWGEDTDFPIGEELSVGPIKFKRVER
jgi:hypothetical protein